MTPCEYEDMYYTYKKYYEHASMEKLRAENEISEIQNRRRSLLNEINQLQAKLIVYKGSQLEMNKGISSSNIFDDCLRDLASKLTVASQGVLAIGSASHCKLQDLNVVFSEKNLKTRNSINSVFSGLRTTNQNLENKITELKDSITRLEIEVADGRCRESNLAYYVSEQKTRMFNALNMMAYSRNHML